MTTKTETKLMKIANQINDGEMDVWDAASELTYDQCKFLDDHVELDGDINYLPPSSAFIIENDLDEEFMETHHKELATTIFFDQFNPTGSHLDTLLSAYAPYLKEEDFKELSSAFYNDLYCGEDEEERDENDWYEYFKSYAN